MLENNFLIRDYRLIILVVKTLVANVSDQLFW